MAQNHQSKETCRSHQHDNRLYKSQHRYEHWYRDNQVYFITARCKGKYPAFSTDRAKLIFWDRFEHYSTKHRFNPWVTSLLNNHYHTIGYLHQGTDLAPMIRCIHGSVAKLVNDTLQTIDGTTNTAAGSGQDSECLNGGRLLPFWGDGRKTYFDGCIRDRKQARSAYQYVLHQSVRHRIVDNWQTYEHTRVNVERQDAITYAVEQDAFMKNVPYRRYERTQIRQ